ncbi:xylose isomerase-like protein [Aspergillus pseudodeflectus]|uniref:Xylose isomerase-like protein n=1 Tax=Aspergillus pseudodeflectus TaxID=176178 RepID=A0ABR4L3L4_9EURO
MVVIKRFRSLWGIEPGPQQTGIEIDFAGMSPEELQLTRSIADEVGLEISVTLFSSWPKYIGPRPAGLTPEYHAEFFREQLKLASILKPVRVNAQSGADHFTWDDSVRFYQLALQVAKEEGFEGRVCHETHRNRSLFNPYAADYILQRVPELKITADISHWVVVSERLLDEGEEDAAILARVIPHVGHIHARTGTTQSSQCPEPLNPVFTAEREFFEKFWVRVIQHRQKMDPDSTLTWVPEYGPYPYHPINTAQTFDELADSEGKRLEALFASVVG